MDDRKFLLETRFFRSIDQNASDVLDKIESNSIHALTMDDRSKWSVFIISLMQRNPEKIAELSVKSKAVLDSLMAELRETYQSRKSANDPTTFGEFLENAKTSGFFERADKLLIQDAILIPASINALQSFCWTIYTFTFDNPKLLTSDRPVMMCNGLGRVGGHIAIPLGPRRVFLATQTAEIADRIVSDPRLAPNFNDRVARQAQTYVYGVNEDQIGFVEPRLRRK
jgi:hypothetical protein